MYRGDSIRGTHTGNQLYIPGGFHEASVRDEISRESSANLLNNDAWTDVPFANVNSFLEHTTPTILLRQLPKVVIFFCYILTKVVNALALDTKSSRHST